MKSSLRIVLLMSIVFIGLVSCKDKAPDNSTSFDRATLLTNVADSIIIPRYTTLNDLSMDFQTAVNDYCLSPNSSSLQNAKLKWLDLYKAWQHCKMYDFGPAMDNSLLRRLNAFPSDTVKIEDNISSGSYNLDLSDQTYAQGLNAFDYLFFHRSESEIINETDANRKLYLNELASIIQDKVNATFTAWGTYRSNFVASTGNDASGSTSLLVNEMNKDFERIKNLKFGFPLGVNVLQTAQPKYLETKYSKNSFLLAKENTQAIQYLWEGRTPSGLNKIGFDDYLNSFETNGQTIKTNTLNDFHALVAYFDNYSSDMKTELETNYNPVYTHFEMYHNMVYHLKSELPSTISILITYQDNDGD